MSEYHGGGIEGCLARGSSCSAGRKSRRSAASGAGCEIIGQISARAYPVAAVSLGARSTLLPARDTRQLVLRDPVKKVVRMSVTSLLFPPSSAGS